MRTEQEMSHLKKLPNGLAKQDGKKLTIKTTRKVRRILATIETSHMPWPNINNTGCGDVTLFWQSATRDMSIVVDKDGDTQFFTSLKQCGRHGEVTDQLDSEGVLTDLCLIDHMVAWYCADKAFSA